jgi:hypothetical protein
VVHTRGKVEGRGEPHAGKGSVVVAVHHGCLWEEEKDGREEEAETVREVGRCWAAGSVERKQGGGLELG